MAQVAPVGDGVSAEMGAHVADIEARLSELDKAFATGDGDAIAHQSQQLQRTLAESLVAFRKAEHAGLRPLDDALRLRLKLAQTRLLAQQAAVHRANASIDRTLKVLFPTEENSTYGNLGQSPIAKALNAYR
ncbi:MAG TPA: hypothetical protein VFW93_10530 [Aquabacterium sp.]|uniref:hypothetical protein n=1 Tax=Aquabacterium sp. TaxID=1872578 RepID=UPI002E3771E5|nr:hypothetical protein [Aquabacterium sp.]HEX5356645.1 hypothetical protein [Aquabacterium sp.]